MRCRRQLRCRARPSDGHETPAHGARAHAPRRAAVSRPASGSRDGLSRVQPARRDHDVALRHRFADRALERGRRALRAEAPDLNALAAEADVDRVVMGTLLRSGDQLRAVAQLVEAPSGTLLTSHTFQSPLGDLFQTAGRHRAAHRRCAGAAARPARLPSPTPQSAAQSAARTSSICGRTSWRAPTTGCRRLGNCTSSCLELDSELCAGVGAHRPVSSRHRQIHSTRTFDSEECAEEAFRRALALNPRLSIAHKFYANLEADMGHAQRGRGAAAWRSEPPWQRRGTVRRTRPRVPVLRAIEQSIAAHAEARRLDPNIATSLQQTC